MLYTGFGAHKLTNFDQFLAIQAQTCCGGVSVCKELYEKFYTSAHLQFNMYELLVGFYLYLAYK